MHGGELLAGQLQTRRTRELVGVEHAGLAARVARGGVDDRALAREQVTCREPVFAIDPSERNYVALVQVAARGTFQLGGGRLG